MQTKHLYVLIHIRIKGRVVPLNLFNPSSDFYLRFQGVASFVDPFCYLCFTFVLLCYIVYSLQPCDHLLGKG